MVQFRRWVHRALSAALSTRNTPVDRKQVSGTMAAIEILENYLKDHQMMFHCRHCLWELVHRLATVPEVEEIIMRFSEMPGFRASNTECNTCQQKKDCVAFVGTTVPHTPSPE